MYNNYDYPMGADNPSAPWNQSDPEPIDVDVCASVTLSKSATVQVDDYQKESWDEYEPNDEGGYEHIGGVNYDFSDCNLEEAFKSQEYTIPELIEVLIKYLKADMANSFHHEEYAKFLLKGCEGWNIDEFEVVKD